MSRSRHSSHRRSGRSSRTPGRQLALVILCCIFGVLTLFLLLCGLLDPTVDLSSLLASLICPASLTLVPGYFLWKARSQVWRARVFSRVARTTAPSPHGYAAVTLRSGERLPKVCVCCGSETRHITPLHYRDQYNDASPYDWNRAWPFLILAPFISFVANVLIAARVWQSIEKRMKRRAATGADVVFHIPHCKPCRKRQPIYQRHFDFHGRSMIIDAHPLFHERLAAMPAQEHAKGD